MSDGQEQPEPTKPGLMRSLGAFVGEIVKAVKTVPERYEAHPPSETAGNEEVVLRRTTTTVDEVVVRKGDPDESGR